MITTTSATTQKSVLDKFPHCGLLQHYDLCSLYHANMWSPSSLLHLHILPFLLLFLFAQCSGYNSTIGLGAAFTAQSSNGSQPLVVLQSPSGGYTVSLDCGNATLTVSNKMAMQGTVLVWVANYSNRTNYAIGTDNISCTLNLGDDGDLQLLATSTKDQNISQVVVWSTGTKGKDVQSLQIQDSGNLALINSTNGTVWQSFDHPTNVLLQSQQFKQGMTLMAADASGYHSGGSYTMVLEGGDLRLYAILDAYGKKALYWSLNSSIGNQIYADLSTVEYASLYQGGLGLFAADSSLVLSTTTQSSQASYQQNLGILNADGNFAVQLLYEGVFWNTNYAALQTDCGNPMVCGTYGICKANSSQNANVNCTCPSSFYVNSSHPGHYSCSPSQSSLQCGHDVELVQLSGTGFTYFSNQFANSSSLPLDQCKQACLQNCSCLAIFSDGSLPNSCYLIFNDVLTIMETSNLNQVAYLKVLSTPKNKTTAGPPSFVSEASSHGINKTVLGILVGLATAFVVATMTLLVFRAKQRTENRTEKAFLRSLPGLPPRFSYHDLQKATNGFGQEIGRGGFGCVYAGIINGDTKIAVKQLEGTGQGQKQFEAEVAAIGRIDHLNLVCLQGFCMEGKHRLLVYEYMEGGSLDKYISGESGIMLHWPERYEIAVGVARGLAYLHEGTDRRIVHCDLKPANILLDSKRRAKISDLGLCKIMCKDLQSHLMTTMRGTRGYLAPEWLLNLPINEKSDVYSYGVVVFELVTGKSIGSMDSSADLQEWISALDRSDYRKEVLDIRLADAAPEQELFRLVKVVVQCTQEIPSLRPKMSSVVKLLEGMDEVVYTL